jgi:murein DD-endopeptidase MepM/ murein hydrolase activator NlpD
MKSLILFAVLIFPMLMSAQTVNFTGKVNSNLSIQYFDASDFEGSSWLWKFGDGQTSTVRNPIHTYVSPGTYSVCLKVDSNTEVCKTDVFTVTESGLEINYDNTIWPNGSFDNLSSPFGARSLNGYDFHRGIDISGNSGDPIYAIADGIVDLAYEFEDPNNPYSGGVVVIKHEMDTPMYFHGLLLTTYYTTNLHLNSVEIGITAGTVVYQGDKVGTVGKTSATFNHNHFEVRVGIQCSREFQRNGGCSSITPFSVPTDPHVNPFLLLDYETYNTNSLSYQDFTNFVGLNLQLFSNRREIDFNEISVFTEDFTRILNFNTREGTDPDDRDNNTFNDITIVPSSYTPGGSEDYEPNFLFSGISNYEAIEVKDIWGNTVNNTDYYGQLFDKLIIYDDFDFSIGNWIDGGNNCFRGLSHSLGGYSKRSMRLKHGVEVANLNPDVDPQSSMFTSALNLQSYTDLRVELFFVTPSGTNGYGNGDDFILEVSTDGGTNYLPIKSWEFGVDFEADIWYHVGVNISNITYTDKTVIRLRSHANSDSDRIYIDNLTIKGKDSSLNLTDFKKRDSINLFPNPTSGKITIIGDIPFKSLEVYNITGQKVLSKNYDGSTYSESLDLSNHKLGTYFVKVKTENTSVTKKLIRF